MDILLFNLSWMTFNLYLASLPVIFSIFMFKMPNRITQTIVGFLWFIYLPNTIYVFTDLHHLLEQWNQVTAVMQLALIVQYMLLEIVGLAFFLVAFYPIEIILRKLQLSKKGIVYWIIVINLLMGFIMTLGKVERVNSWDVFTNPQFAIVSGFNLITSVNLIFLSLLFGLFANFFYFLFRSQTKKLYSKLKIFNR